ncbi:MAG: ketol-acid reductoisomerase [Phycisphaerae bacterium]|nr:ketol-acid reductoisomerase [Phycisphaerae bacterium]
MGQIDRSRARLHSDFPTPWFSPPPPSISSLAMPLPSRGTVIHAADAPIEPLLADSGRTTSVLGYGNQGRAHALNLRDSGVSVVIGGRPGSAARKRAAEDGFETFDHAEAAGRSDLVIIALPDEVHGEVWRTSLVQVVRPGQVLGVIHGFSLHHGDITPPEGVGAVLVAPKGPGRTVRERFLLDQGIPAIISVHQEVDASKMRGTPITDAAGICLAWTTGLGCTRGGSIVGSVADETETDLFGEQAVLCGGVTGLVTAAYEILIDAGYPPEVAYIECCHELKQVCDLIYHRGLAGMRAAISNTAEFGIDHAAPRLVDDAVKSRMRDLLAEIRDGRFAARLRDDADSDFPDLRRHRTDTANHPMETSGRTVRGLMPWLAEEDAKSQATVPTRADQGENSSDKTHP